MSFLLRLEHPSSFSNSSRDSNIALGFCIGLVSSDLGGSWFDSCLRLGRQAWPQSSSSSLGMASRTVRPLFASKPALQRRLYFRSCHLPLLFSSSPSPLASSGCPHSQPLLWEGLEEGPGRSINHHFKRPSAEASQEGHHFSNFSPH